MTVISVLDEVSYICNRVTVLMAVVTVLNAAPRCGSCSFSLPKSGMDSSSDFLLVNYM